MIVLFVFVCCFALIAWLWFVVKWVVIILVWFGFLVEGVGMFVGCWVFGLVLCVLYLVWGFVGMLSCTSFLVDIGYYFAC